MLYIDPKGHPTFISIILQHFMSKFHSHFLKYIVLGLLFSTSFYSQILGNEQNNTISKQNGYLNRIILANSEDKLSNLTFSNNPGKILILDIPELNDDHFATMLKSFWGKKLDTSLLSDLVQAIKTFLATKGINNVYIDYNHNQINNNDLKLYLVINPIILNSLYLSPPAYTDPKDTSHFNYGDIYITNLPNYLLNSKLKNYVGGYFGKPITPETLNSLIFSISKYIQLQSSYLAAAQVPKQDLKNGLLKLNLIVGDYPLQRLVILGNGDKDSKTPINPKAGSVQALNNSTYNTQEFKKFITHYIDQPISVELVDKLKSDLIAYGKNHDKLIIDATQTYIDFNSGEIKIVVVVGKYSQLHIKGNRWFSDELIIRQLGVKAGDEINLSELDNAVAWANRNPFMQVQVALDTLNKPTGLADLDLSVNEVRPIRVSASYSNAINNALGSSSYSTAVQIGNFLNTGQEINLQYSTNNTPKYYQSYSFDYKVPLLWHDYLRLDVAYSLAYPQSILGYVGLNQKAKNTVLDLKYIKTFTKGNWTYELSTGIDYKQVNTNLEFGLFTEPMSVYDIAEIVPGLTVIKKDTLGSWTTGLSLYLSPGGFNNRNSEKSFRVTPVGGITGDSSRYLYNRFVFERDTLLPLNFVSVSRLTFQGSTTNLQGSEQLLIGGGASVRGYSQSYTGDQGIIFNEEIRSPYFQNHIPFTNSKNKSVNTQFVAFYDYGRIAYKHPTLAQIGLPTLMGTGIGIRSSILGYFNMGSDISWPLRNGFYTDPHPTKGTFWITLAY